MKLDPLQVFWALLRHVVVLLVIVAAIYFIFSFRIIILTNEIERTNVELAENLFSSPLTYDRAVFDADKIEEMISKANSDFHTNDEAPNIEPEARHCRLGYHAEIEDLKTEQSWAFGYVPDEGKDLEERFMSRMAYAAAVVVKGRERGYEDAHPARLTLTLRETWLSKIGCMVEEAYEFRETRTLEAPCIYEARGNIIDIGSGATSSTKFCVLEVGKADNAKHTCLRRPKTSIVGETEPAECRYFWKDIDVTGISHAEEKSEFVKKKLSVYPLKDKPTDAKETCKKLAKKDIEPAKGNDKVEAVILCVH